MVCCNEGINVVVYSVVIPGGGVEWFRLKVEVVRGGGWVVNCFFDYEFKMGLGGHNGWYKGIVEA
jgi:hypothetical protein